MVNKKIKIITFFILIIIFAWYSFVFEPNNLKVERVMVKINNLPSSFENAKIIQLSDFHCKKFIRRDEKVLEMVASLNPDFIFITGDIVDRNTQNIDSCKMLWQTLGEKYPNKVYAIFGNHDFENYQSSYLEQSLNESGVILLNNKNQELEKNGDKIELIGVVDPGVAYNRVEKKYGLFHFFYTKEIVNYLDDLPKAFEGVNNDEVKIVLSHSPDIVWDLNNQENPDLILTGHTHGGQVKIPYLRAFWSPTKDHGKYISGLFKINNFYLYVNRGIGTSSLPIRFNSDPEITLIELKK